MSKVLILTDGKAGHENQSKALARALGCDFDLREIAFRTKFHKALSYLFDRLGLRTLALFRPAAPDRPTFPPYAAVLGTGSGTFYAAKAMARHLGVTCAVVLFPRGYDLASFDAILAPAFDRPPPRANVIEIPANLVANDAAFYAKGVAAFRAHYAAATGRTLPERPEAVAVIVGGPNKCSTMTVGWMKRQLDSIFGRDRESGGAKPVYWVTTSRRTPPEVEALIDAYPWDYKLLYSKDRFNPIPAFVQLARKLYVTAESTGMLSESCTFGSAEVIALDNLNPGPHKFRRFVENLRAEGYVDGNRKIDLSGAVRQVRAILGI